MKLFFLLIVVPLAIVAQDLVIEPIDPIRPIRPPIGPLPVEKTTTAAPRILPKKPFIVVSNGIIRPNSPFNVAVRRFGSTSRSIYLTLTLAGTSDNGVAFSKKKYATVKSGSTSAFVTFDASKIPRGSYVLKVEGEEHEEKRSLGFASKDASLLMQLEKAIYSPGQTVRFRLFAIDSLTNAVSPSDACSITVRDSNYNTIENYVDLKFVKGKYENTLALGERAPEGIWQVVTVCGNEQIYEEFEVAEYKLPAFSVSLNVPTQTPFSNGKVPVQVTAVYSFGTKVDGTAKFSLSRWGEPILTRDITITNGEASFELEVKQDLNAYPDSWNSFEYSVEVTDSTLNQKVSVEGYFQVVPYKFTIQMTGSNVLTPGSSYSYSVLVKTDDNVFPPKGTKVTVNIYGQDTVQELTLNAVGFASSSINVASGTTYLSFVASAPESIQGYLYAYVQSGSPGSISLYPNYGGETSAKLNKWIDIKAVVSDKPDWIAYFVSAKGVLLDSQRVSVKSKTKSATIWVKPDIRHYPYFYVTAAYLQGVDLVLGQVQINLRDKLNNFVKLSFGEVEVKPGTNYSFSVESKCDSTVSLSAIDQRVLQLRSDNEITKDNVMNAISQYEWSDYLPYEDDYSYRPSEWIFQGVKLRIFTNLPPPPKPEYYYDRNEALPDRPQEKESMRPGGSDGPGNDVKIRKDFSETFCWTDAITKQSVSYSSSEECENSCRARVNCKVPDSITKYLFYSVSMNQKYGIGVTDIPSNITVFLPFFCVWDPPYSIKRNENMNLDITCFNSINQDQNVVVTITKNSNFEAIAFDAFGWTETATGFEKTIAAKANTNFNVQFDLKYLSVGIFNLQFVARGNLAGDGFERPIRVIPEGIPRTISRSVMIVEDSPAEAQLTCEYPEGVYEDTKQVLATVIGDVLGKALNNLDNLIQMPGGCGEQNLLYLVPDIVILRYLETTGKLTPELDAKLKQYIAAGIQNQLNYRRYDGSFSAFGNSDESGSTWLTVYSAFSFYLAKDYVTVDENVIQQAINFVIANQNPDGSFVEPGRVIHVDMQGGTSNGLGMIAYITSILTLMLGSYPEYQTSRDNALNYIVTALENTEDVYELAIGAYTLLLKNQLEPQATVESADSIFDKFFAKRIDLGTEIYWQKTINPPNFWYSALSLDTETTAYGLKALAIRGDTTNALKVAKYLTSQTNQFGGFSSSQDTVMAISSLTQFFESFALNGANVDLTLEPNVGAAFSAKVDSTNIMTLQQFELDANTDNLRVVPSASSTGIAVVSLICNYYQDPAAVEPSFNVNSEYFRQCKYSLGIKVCASYIPEGNSNMAIVTVNLPSGFQYQEWWGGPNNPDVSKVETFNSNSKVVFYFNSIGNKESCVEVNAYRAQTVSQLKGGTIIVNDYYDTAKEGTAKFDAPDTTQSCYWGPRFRS
jgi:CD109 antigen